MGTPLNIDGDFILHHAGGLEACCEEAYQSATLGANGWPNDSIAKLTVDSIFDRATIGLTDYILREIRGANNIYVMIYGDPVNPVEITRYSEYLCAALPHPVAFAATRLGKTLNPSTLSESAADIATYYLTAMREQRDTPGKMLSALGVTCPQIDEIWCKLVGDPEYLPREEPGESGLIVKKFAPVNASQENFDNAPSRNVPPIPARALTTLRRLGFQDKVFVDALGCSTSAYGSRAGGKVEKPLVITEVGFAAFIAHIRECLEELNDIQSKLLVGDEE